MLLLLGRAAAVALRDDVDDDDIGWAPVPEDGGGWKLDANVAPTIAFDKVHGEPDETTRFVFTFMFTPAFSIWEAAW